MDGETPSEDSQPSSGFNLIGVYSGITQEDIHDGSDYSDPPSEEYPTGDEVVNFTYENEEVVEENVGSMSPVTRNADCVSSLENVEETNLLALEIALAESSQTAAQPQDSRQPPNRCTSSPIENFDEADQLALEIALAESLQTAAQFQDSTQLPNTDHVSSSPRCSSPTCDCRNNNDGSYFPESTPAVNTQSMDRISRKRPHNEVDDIRPGQWVAVSINGETIPGKFIKHSLIKFQVAMCSPKKSGWHWGQKLELDRSSISKIIDNPVMTTQKGSKSKLKSTVFYF